MQFRLVETIFSDFSQLEGSCCYCSEETAAEIRRRISGMPLHAIHLIGTGDYHYQTLFWLERVGRPFSLILLDNHPDDQPGAFGPELLSCGNWVLGARRLPALQHFLWIRRASDMDAAALPATLPLYISVDIDVLSTEYARTGWDQGGMSLAELTGLLGSLRARYCGPGGPGIIGADICGGVTRENGGCDADFELNRRCINAIVEAISGNNS